MHLFTCRIKLYVCTRKIDAFCRNFELLNRGFLPHHCSFSRVGFALVGQENQDANFGEDNYIFFLSGIATGKVLRVCAVVLCMANHLTRKTFCDKAQKIIIFWKIFMMHIQ